jgi:putative membrane-bound dehydrogenase-like protein
VRRKEGEGKDRIVIFEDTDGDGHFDKRTVFMEGLNLVSGLEVGFGGVWIGAAPYLMYVPIAEGEDKPAGKPEILLDGWHYEDTHETLNAFRWGPDGWLYGCHGVFTHSRVGKPGTPNQDRTPINAGIWRYHPTKHVFEVFAQGTSNPWGIDFDARGQAFIEACVIPHAFHIIQNGRYQRQAGEHFNPYTYADIQTIADHLHWQGANPWAGNNRSDAMGGGHAHAGLMIYQGGAWPEEYNGKMFMGNVHGHRLNMDVLKPKGSGFVASHGHDFLNANDAWSRLINMRVGPDGNLYVIDWYDKQACHVGDRADAWDRSNGRVYKVSYRGTKAVTGVDLAKKSDKELVELLSDKNEWYARHARRLLQERAANKKLEDGTREALAKVAFESEDEGRRLRGLWALHVTGGLTQEGRLGKALTNDSAYVRAWALQLGMEDGKPDDMLLRSLAALAAEDRSSVVRLYAASAAQRLPAEKRWDTVEALVRHGEDATDPNLPLMDWYAAEPLAEIDPGRALDLAGQAKVPLLLQFMARRVAATLKPAALEQVVRVLSEAPDAGRELTLLHAVNEALKGHRHVEMPKGWADVFARLSQSKDAEVRSQSLALAVTFGDPKAMAELRSVLASKDAAPAARQGALAALLGAGDKELAPVLQGLVADKAVRGGAIRGLADYDDPKTPGILLGAYPSLTLEEKREVLTTLAARAAYGRALMEAVAAAKVPAADVPAETVRQLRNLKDSTLDALIVKAWGTVRKTPADRAKLIAGWKKKLSNPDIPVDLPLGRAMFAKTCQQCHTLYGVGGKVGPDITGSNRANLDYLLENVLDPSAVIPNDYKASVVELKSGKVVTGIVRPGAPGIKNVLTANETLVIADKDIDEIKASDVSMMPDDVLKPLSEMEIRSLIAYLRNPTQVPMLATADNAKDLFNGKDLSGWDGDPKLWSVENGEIVGKSPGIKKNEFLKSHIAATDFRLTLKVKLVPNKENSGVQFRSEALPDGEMRGPQADVGLGWWGKLYEENGRQILSQGAGEKHVKVDDWNEYEIVAQGGKVKTVLNGVVSVDLDDPKISPRGIFALQIHAGGPMEVRFKDIKLEVLPPKDAEPKK